MRTLHDMVAAIDRALPLCEAVAQDPAALDARQALFGALAALADESFLEPSRQTRADIGGLCNFVHIQAIIVRDCLTRSDAPDHLTQFLIGTRARDLLLLLPELKKAIGRAAG